MHDWEQPTSEQFAYVAALCKRLRLPSPLLDRYCCDTWGRPYAKLDRRQVSRLIDELKGWQEIPAHLRRLQGQTDLPGFGT